MENFGDLLGNIALLMFLGLELYWSARLVMFVDKHARRYHAVTLALFIIAVHAGMIGSQIGLTAELAKIGR